jgi:hypothetical protein
MQNLIKSTPAWALLLEQGVFELTEIGHVEIDDVVIESIAIPHRAELSDMHALLFEEKSILFSSYQIMIHGIKRSQHITHFNSRMVEQS